LKKKQIRIVAVVILCMMMVVSLAACGGGSGGSSTAAPPAAPAGDSGAAAPADDADAGAAAPAGDSGTYKIGYLNFGPDWILNRFMEEAKEAALWANPSNDFIEADGGYMADTMTGEVQKLLAGGAQGLCYDAHFDNMLPGTVEACKSADAALLIAHVPPFPESMHYVLEYDKFVGYFGSDLYQAGFQLGERAAADGFKKAIIASGAKGTLDMNGKIDGFNDGFIAGGGEILDTITTTLPTEVEGKVADSLAAHPDCDVIYGSTGAHTLGSISAAEKAGMTLSFYSSDLDPDLTQMVADGKIKAGDAGASVEWVMGMALLINFLDGHPIKDDAGQAPVIDWMKPLLVDQTNAKVVLDNWISNHPISETMFKNYLYAYNPDVTYADFTDFADNYAVDWFQDAKSKF
jgi:ABC-type sugar transport system substrate-binding protein